MTPATPTQATPTPAAPWPPLAAGMNGAYPVGVPTGRATAGSRVCVGPGITLLVLCAFAAGLELWLFLALRDSSGWGPVIPVLLAYYGAIPFLSALVGGIALVVGGRSRERETLREREMLMVSPPAYPLYTWASQSAQ